MSKLIYIFSNDEIDNLKFAVDLTKEFKKSKLEAIVSPSKGSFINNVGSFLNLDELHAGIITKHSLNELNLDDIDELTDDDVSVILLKKESDNEISDKIKSILTKNNIDYTYIYQDVNPYWEWGSVAINKNRDLIEEG